LRKNLPHPHHRHHPNRDKAKPSWNYHPQILGYQHLPPLQHQNIQHLHHFHHLHQPFHLRLRLLHPSLLLFHY
jgi:hypothetical protein